jgi:hypothetical protein
LSQTVYEGEDEYLVMQRSLDELFREERSPVNVMLAKAQHDSVDEYLEE